MGVQESGGEEEGRERRNNPTLALIINYGYPPVTGSCEAVATMRQWVEERHQEMICRSEGQKIRYT